MLCFINIFVSRYRKKFSFTRVECPTVSDYKKYGELHILRCLLEGPIQTPNDCDPVAIECGEYK